MPIKALIISNYNDLHSTRPEAEIFIGLAKQGFDISIMTFGETPFADAFKEAGIKLIDFHPKDKNNTTEISRIRKYLIDNNIQVMMLFNSEAIVSGIKAAKNLPTKVVLYRGYDGNINWWDPSAYLKYLHPRVDKIVCNSKGVEQTIQNQLFVKKDKTITINKGHRVEWYDDYKAIDIKKELNIEQDALLFVNVCINRRMKGLPYYFKAINMLPKNLKAHFLFVGKDMETKENLDLVNASVYKENIHFLGFRKDALSIVKACDVFVLPSIKGESITKSVIEAMCLSKPCIISDIKGNVELQIKEYNQFIVKAKDQNSLSKALVNMIQFENRLEMAKASRKHIEEQLNCDNTVKEYGDLFIELSKS